MLNIGNRWELVVEATPRLFYSLNRASEHVLDLQFIADFMWEL